MESVESKVHKLELEIERLKKINKALMFRVESSVADGGGAFKSFEGGILLEKEIKKRTKELEIANERNSKQASFFRKTIDTFPLCFCVKDMEGKLILTNQAFCQLTGKSFDELIGSYYRDHFDEDSGKLLVETAERARATTSVHQCDISFTANGKQKYFQTIHFPYIDQNGNVFSLGCIGLDLTESRKLEQMMVHSAKLASIGELAAGIGHEINNPLTIIDGSVAKLLRIVKSLGIEKDQFEKIGQAIKKIENSSGRIANIVSGLRTFARDEGVIDSSAKFNLKELINETLEMTLDIYKKEGIEFVFEHSSISDECIISGDGGKLQQVLINLLNNSRDAMSSQKNKMLELSIVENSGHVEILIQDNGPGVPEKLKQKIFDPFFTTKPVGVGTGIGLSIVNKIVHDELGGTILVEDNKPQGAIFKITLPC